MASMYFDEWRNYILAADELGFPCITHGQQHAILIALRSAGTRAEQCCRTKLVTREGHFPTVYYNHR